MHVLNYLQALAATISAIPHSAISAVPGGFRRVGAVLIILCAAAAFAPLELTAQEPANSGTTAAEQIQPEAEEATDATAAQASTPAPEPTAAEMQALVELTDKIQKSYAAIKSFEGVFRQVNYDSESKALGNAEGKVYYHRPGKMRWDYLKPDPQLLVTDGETVWLYDPVLENVTISPLGDLAKGTPLSFLLGAGDLKADFDSRPATKSLVADGSLKVAELVPREPLASLEFIQLAVDPVSYDLRQIILAESSGSYRRISFENLSLNLEISADLFAFKVTDEMEVISADR